MSSTTKTENKPKLLDQLRQAVRLRNYSIRTEHSYVDWVYRYIMFHKKRHPAEMGAPEITAFLSHLATDLNVAASTQNSSSHYGRRPGVPGGNRPSAVAQASSLYRENARPSLRHTGKMPALRHRRRHNENC